MSERPTKGLGMGLQALLGEAARAPAPEGQGEGRGGGVREIEISRIQRNPEQPRVRLMKNRSGNWPSPFANEEFSSQFSFARTARAS